MSEEREHELTAECWCGPGDHLMTGISARDVAVDLATDLTKLARIGCCADRRKPCGYHEGWGDGLDNFCHMFFSSKPIS